MRYSVPLPYRASGRKSFFEFLGSLVKRTRPFSNSNDLTEEIHDLMDEGQAKGIISDEESHMVSGVLDLKETTAHSVMVPRTSISSAPAHSTLGEVIRLVNKCGHTRIPIYDSNIDDITGILHAKDLLKLHGNELSSKIPAQILRKPLFVPGSKNIGVLLRELKREKTHLAIVTDEYGGTAGIITLEDIIEEIVGEILDEHDREKVLLTANRDGSLLVDARLEITKLEEYLAIKLPKGDFESVGGLVISLTGSIPRVDEKILVEDLEMIVKEADQRKIGKILIKHKSLPEPDIEESLGS